MVSIQVQPSSQRFQTTKLPQLGYVLKMAEIWPAIAIRKKIVHYNTITQHMIQAITVASNNRWYGDLFA